MLRNPNFHCCLSLPLTLKLSDIRRLCQGWRFGVFLPAFPFTLPSLTLVLLRLRVQADFPLMAAVMELEIQLEEAMKILDSPHIVRWLLMGSLF